MGVAIEVRSNLPVSQRIALEQLIFFNINQHRVRLGIQQSIETYGVPEIYEDDGMLAIRVGDIVGVRNVFAVAATGKPLGVAVFVRSGHERFAVLHLGLEPQLQLTRELNTRVLLKLMHEIRRAARTTQGIERIELVYRHSHTVRLHA